MGPIRYIRYRRAHSRAERLRAVWHKCGCEYHRRLLVDAFVDEGRIKYAKMLRKLRDL